MSLRAGLPVIRGVRFLLAHTPGLVPYGSKPARDLADAAAADAFARAAAGSGSEGVLAGRLRAHLRGWDAARAYPPH